MPNFNPTPKQIFLKDATIVREHNNWINSQSVQHALNMALLEFQRRNDTATDFNSAAMAQCRTEGALLFLDIFKRLGEVPTPPPKPTSDNLQAQR